MQGVDPEGMTRRHGDPSDRLPITQAPVEGLPMLTDDHPFDRHPVELV